ncbi:CBS domain-containing protein [Streptomyces piniterrae]|uniref:CBS domain-containing protein n=1 Tax=Streptomyces piniterrae TaxID=2571125 RepID=A0A4U0NW49_9ACTN|nr:CBS domain-containing protein [Streptomyces piniterrae]TJZ58975.1 CBS domain-containing protein [Streptomyces piniterrae]
MKIREVMRTPVVTVATGTTLRETAQRMAQHTVGCVVVTAGGTARGMVTDRDLAIRGIGAGLDADAPVTEVMSEPVVTVRADDDVDEAYRTMCRSGVRRLPVLDGARIAGAVTLDDLLLDVSRRLGELLVPLSWCVLGDQPGPPVRSPGKDRAAGR